MPDIRQQAQPSSVADIFPVQTKRQRTKPTRNIPYRQADHIVQKLPSTVRQSTSALRLPLTLSTRKIAELSAAFAHIDVAEKALSNAQLALAELGAGDLTSQSTQQQMRSVGVAIRKVQGLAHNSMQAEDESTEERYAKAPDVFGGLNILTAALEVASDQQPEQEAALGALLNR